MAGGIQTAGGNALLAEVGTHRVGAGEAELFVVLPLALADGVAVGVPVGVGLGVANIAPEAWIG